MKTTKIASMILLVMLIAWGCANSAEQESTTNTQVQQKEQPKQGAQTGNIDSHGRNASDPHFGHNHSPSEKHTAPNANSAAPASGEPDKFGRKPGDPHYGHNHQ